MMPLWAVPFCTWLLTDPTSSPVYLYLKSPGTQTDGMRSSRESYRHSLGDVNWHGKRLVLLFACGCTLCNVQWWLHTAMNCYSMRCFQKKINVVGTRLKRCYQFNSPKALNERILEPRMQAKHKQKFIRNNRKFLTKFYWKYSTLSYAYISSGRVLFRLLGLHWHWLGVRRTSSWPSRTGYSNRQQQQQRHLSAVYNWFKLHAYTGLCNLRTD